MYSFNAPVEFAKAIKNVGADMVMCANNHCLDRDCSGLMSTIKNLDDCGLIHIGTHVKKEKQYKIVDIDGFKIGFLNFTYGTNAFSNNVRLKHRDYCKVDMLQKQELHNRVIRKIWFSQNKYAFYLKLIAKKLGIGQFDVMPYERQEGGWFLKRRFIKAIKECRKRADYVIVLPHIGGQYNEVPSEYTKEICNASIKAGADAVIANHEHVVHPIDKQYLSSGRIVAYSIGNFFGVNGSITEPFDKMSEYSIAVHIDIERDKEPKYSFSIYKTIVDSDELKTVPLYDLIDKSAGTEKDKLIQDNGKIFKNVTGFECTDVKEFYKI